MRFWTGLVAAAVLYGSAFAINASRDRGTSTTISALVRPLALPFLWPGVTDARQHGSVGEHVARGRLLMRLLPGWLDGHLYFASQLVFDGRKPGSDPDGACDRLFTALAWLEEVRGQFPDQQEVILAAMASLLEIRSAQDPALAKAIRDRENRDAVEIADDLLGHAEQLSPTATLRERRVFLAPKLMASALRTADESRFEILLEDALVQAQQVRDRDLAARFTEDLEQMRSYWLGDPVVTLEDLRGRSLLAELVPFLPQRTP